MQTTIENTTAKTHKVVLGNFGNGRYTPVMEELYADTQRLLGFSKEQAHVTAVRIGVDAGQLQSLKVEGLKYGKTISKDGRRTLKEVVKAGKLVNSWAMSIGHICSSIDELRKQGLEVVELTIHNDLLNFVNEAVKRIEPVETLEN